MGYNQVCRDYLAFPSPAIRNPKKQQEIKDSKLKKTTINLLMLLDNSKLSKSSEKNAGTAHIVDLALLISCPDYINFKNEATEIHMKAV